MRRRYPILGDVPYSESSSIHCDIQVIWADGAPPVVFCGDNWCTGTCGLPALVIPGTEPRKASGSQVAMGQAFQSLRVKWKGPIVEVPVEHRKDLGSRWYL